MGIPQFRSAILKAQQIVGLENEWAGTNRMITLAKGYEVRARQLHPGTTPVGAITEDMLLDLCNIITHDEKEAIRRLAKAEFYGCFRISELLKMKITHVKEDSVILVDPKSQKALAIVKAPLSAAKRKAQGNTHENEAMAIHVEKKLSL